MKAKDLRIGNYINQNDGNGFYRVDVDIQVLKRLLSSDWEFEPIPLTEEWLVKLGLTEDQYSDSLVRRYDFPDDRFVIFLDDDGDCPISFEGNTLIYIQHVHQLQNLYQSVTGEELTIKNYQL